MKKRAYIYIGLLTFILLGCGRQVRINMISEHSGLMLPEKYSVIRNTTESSGISDFEINVILKIEELSLNKIKLACDSLILTNSQWKKEDGVYKYSNQLTNSESETIVVDLKKSVLTFNFLHL